MRDQIEALRAVSDKNEAGLIQFLDQLSFLAGTGGPDQWNMLVDTLCMSHEIDPSDEAPASLAVLLVVQAKMLFALKHGGVDA